MAASERARNPREAKKKPRQSVSKVRRGGNVSSKVTAKQTVAVKQLKTLIRSRMWRLHPAEGLPDSRRLVEFSAEKKKEGHLEVFLSPQQTSRVPAGLSVDSGRQKSLSIWCSVIVFLGCLFFLDLASGILVSPCKHTESRWESHWVHDSLISDVRLIIKRRCM